MIFVVRRCIGKKLCWYPRWRRRQRWRLHHLSDRSTSASLLRSYLRRRGMDGEQITVSI